jgi:hypothetical protein
MVQRLRRPRFVPLPRFPPANLPSPRWEVDGSLADQLGSRDWLGRQGDAVVRAEGDLETGKAFFLRHAAGRGDVVDCPVAAAAISLKSVDPLHQSVHRQPRAFATSTVIQGTRNIERSSWASGTGSSPNSI